MQSNMNKKFTVDFFKKNKIFGDRIFGLIFKSVTSWLGCTVITGLQMQKDGLKLPVGRRLALFFS